MPATTASKVDMLEIETPCTAADLEPQHSQL
jgi:hypothetical protein